jgi:PAS domain S-box-containing protein
MDTGHPAKRRRIQNELNSGRHGLLNASIRCASANTDFWRSIKTMPVFSHTPYIVFDQSGIIREANLQATLLLTLPKADLIGCAVTRFIHPQDQAAYQYLEKDCRASGDTHTAEFNLVQAGGRCFPAQFQMQCMPESTRGGHEFRAVLLDLSDKERISANLNLLNQCLETAVQAHDSQQLLDAYVAQIKRYLHCSAVGIRLRDDRGRIPFQAYTGFSEQFYQSESPISLHSDRCLCVEVVMGRGDPAWSCFTEYGSFFVNGTSRFQDDLPPDLLDRIRSVCNAHGYESVALIPIAIDRTISGLIHVADRRENMFPLHVVQVLEQVAMRLGLTLQQLHLQSRLTESVDVLRELSSHLLIAKEEEQRRIAMELHDQTGQDLNVLKLRLRKLRNRLRKDQPALKQCCAEMLDFTDEIIANVRHMVHGLNPPTLDALGLSSAVRQMAREFKAHAGIDVHTEIDLLDAIDSRSGQIGLFRIIQEALTNVHKHACARRVKIRTFEEKEPPGIRVVIEDDGHGFDRSDADIAKGMGLAAMRLRSRMIGARTTIQSAAGQGTRITIRLPGETPTGAS